MSVKNELAEDFDSYIAVIAVALILLITHDLVASPQDCISCGVVLEATGISIKHLF